MLFIFWFASAFAGTLVEEAGWPVSGAASDVEAVDRDGIPYVVVATRSDVVVLDAAGFVVHTLGRGAADVAAYDADGDGAPDLAVCSTDGLWLVPWTGSGLGTPSLVDGAACEAVVAHDLDGASGIASAAADELSIWWDDGAGGLGAVELADAGLTGDPLLASGAGALAAVSAGDIEIWERTAAGEATPDAGGIVTGIARGAAGWQVALWDERSVGPLGGSGFDLAAGPRVIGVGDLDGDGAEDLLALTDDTMLVWVPGSGGSAQSVPLGEDGAALAVVDLDGDGCDEVVVGLGFTSDVVVAGLDVCPASCDPAVLVESPDAVEEGTPATFTASLDACGAEATGWEWSVDGAAPEDCVADGASLACTFPDDAAVSISATATSSFGDITGSVDLQVANVAPTILTGDFVEVVGGIATARVPCGGQVQLMLFDPGADTITVIPAEDGNYRVNAAGLLSGPPFEGEAGYIVVEVVDEDGGVGVYDLEATTPSCGDDTGWDDTGWADPGPAPGGDIDCCGACCTILGFLLFGIRGFGLLTALARATE